MAKPKPGEGRIGAGRTPINKVRVTPATPDLLRGRTMINKVRVEGKKKAE